jgi:hypothetical protein
MKKSIMFIVLGLLLLTSFSLAEEVNNGKETTADGPLSSLRDFTRTNTTRITDREIEIPSQFKLLYAILSGFDEKDKIPLSKLITLIIFAIIIAFVCYSILDFTAFESKWIKITISLSITLIFAVLGMINNLTEIIFNGKELIILWLRSWEFYAITATLIVVFMLSKIIFKFYKKQETFNKAEEVATKAGASLKGLARISEKMAETAKKK